MELNNLVDNVNSLLQIQKQRDEVLRELLRMVVRHLSTPTYSVEQRKKLIETLETVIAMGEDHATH